MKKIFNRINITAIIAVYFIANIFESEWLWGLGLMLVASDILVEYFSSPEAMYAEYPVPIKSRFYKNLTFLFGISMFICGVVWIFIEI